MRSTVKIERRQVAVVLWSQWMHYLGFKSHTVELTPFVFHCPTTIVIFTHCLDLQQPQMGRSFTVQLSYSSTLSSSIAYISVFKNIIVNLRAAHYAQDMKNVCIIMNVFWHISPESLFNKTAAVSNIVHCCL